MATFITMVLFEHFLIHTGKIEADLQVILLREPHLLLGCPYNEPLLRFMIPASCNSFQDDQSLKLPKLLEQFTTLM